MNDNDGYGHDPFRESPWMREQRLKREERRDLLAAIRQVVREEVRNALDAAPAHEKEG